MRVNTAHEPMTHAQLREVAPSIFATRPHSRVSSRYKFIPTIKVVEHMEKNGLVPVSATQLRSRDPENRLTTKHIIRFGLPEDRRRRLILNDTVPEIILLNAHNGGGTYQLSAGVFRLICLMGMVASDSRRG